jgi:tight adherence protein B
MILVILLVVFVSIFVLAAGAVLIATRILERKQKTAGVSSLAAGFEGSSTILKMEEFSSITIWDNLLNRFDFVEGMRARIAQADLSWSVGRLTSLMLLIGAFVQAILSGVSWTPFWLDVLLALGAASLPYVYVLHRRSKRLDQFEKQFPDALDFLARSLRAGHPLPVCLELLSQDESAPLSTEMRKTNEERKLGMPLDQALTNLSKRVPLLTVRVFVAAVRLQGRTGGRLSDVLTNMSETMRESISVEGEVKALAAHGRVTGAVLTVLPVIIALLMTAVNPGYLNILVENSTGRHLVAGCLVALVAAHLVIRKIVNVKI